MRIQFTLRDLFWAVLVTAVALGWWLERPPALETAVHRIQFADPKRLFECLHLRYAAEPNSHVTMINGPCADDLFVRAGQRAAGNRLNHREARCRWVAADALAAPAMGYNVGMEPPQVPSYVAQVDCYRRSIG